MKRRVLVLMLMLACGAARAQAPLAASGEPETVYSDAQRQKDDSTARHFVQGYLAPQQGLEDAYSRWKRKVCPKVFGLTPLATWQVEHRIKEIADKVGAPVDRDDPCNPNILVVFSEQPQKALDTIADARWELVVQRSRRLKMQYPIQSWYETAIRDCNGALWLDIGDDQAPGQACESRLFTGLTAEMAVATVVVDANAVIGLPLQTVADYIAVTTLSQTIQRGTCQPAPTIANLMVKGCAAEDQSSGITDVDLAMLTALYHAPERPEILQRQLILKSMKDALAKGAPP